MNVASTTERNHYTRLKGWTVRQKIGFGFIGLILLMTLGMSITLYNLDKIKYTAALAIEERQPAANYFQRLTQNINLAIALLNAYLLTGEVERKNAFFDTIDTISERLEGAGRQAIFKKLELVGTLNTSLALLQQFREQADELFTLHDNKKSNSGLLRANELLNTQSVELLGNINILLSGDDMDTNDPELLQALATLQALRYNWARMMWALSLYVNSPSPTQLENFSTFKERVNVLMTELNQQNVTIGFGEIESIKNAYRTYFTNLPSVLKMFETDEWQTSVNLLRTQVQPITDQLQTILENTADGLLESAFDNSQELSEALYQIRISAIVILVLALLTGTLLAMGISRSIVPPIRRLMTAAGKVAEGDLNAEVMITSEDEIGQLGNSFNTMISHLRAASMKEQLMLDELQNLNQDLEKRVEQRTKALEQSETKIRAILDNIGEGIIVLDESGKIESMNPAAEQIFAMTEEESIGINSALLSADYDVEHFIETSPDIRDNHAFDEQSKNRQPKEHLGIRSDGTTFPMEMVVSGMNVGHRRLRVCIVRDITTRKETEDTLADVQNQLVNAAHKSGMAEMATGVLHNIGNILNSVNLSGEEIQRVVKNSKISGLLKANDLLSQHKDNMNEFLTQDPRGQKIPAYFIKMGKVLNDEIHIIKSESHELIKKTTMMKEVISTQQAYAKSGFHSEQLFLPELIEDALKIQDSSLRKWGVRVRKDFADTPPCMGQKSKLLQVITNLIKNAKEAVSDNDQFNRPKELIIKTGTLNDTSVYLKVQDNGCGIRPSQLNKIFNHGFTTKETGHGFGLHSSANAMTEMHGSLKVDSDGVQKGACFTVTLPIDQAA